MMATPTAASIAAGEYDKEVGALGARTTFSTPGEPAQLQNATAMGVSAGRSRTSKVCKLSLVWSYVAVARMVHVAGLPPGVAS